MPPFVVASYVGAWIETVPSRYISTLSEVASYVGAWIETKGIRRAVSAPSGRILCGCVD